jgi:hypothetical protein
MGNQEKIRRKVGITACSITNSKYIVYGERLDS